jgi:hypothetical protein
MPDKNSSHSRSFPRSHGPETSLDLNPPEKKPREHAATIRDLTRESGGADDESADGWRWHDSSSTAAHLATTRGGAGRPRSEAARETLSSLILVLEGRVVRVRGLCRVSATYARCSVLLQEEVRLQQPG